MFISSLSTLDVTTKQREGGNWVMSSWWIYVCFMVQTQCLKWVSLWWIRRANVSSWSWWGIYHAKWVWCFFSSASIINNAIFLNKNQFVWVARSDISLKSFFAFLQSFLQLHLWNRLIVVDVTIVYFHESIDQNYSLCDQLLSLNPKRRRVSFINRKDFRKPWSMSEWSY
jgi:hypothetical protein